MSIANVSSPEDNYGRSGNLLPPERPSPAIYQNFEEGGISFGNYMNQNGDMTFEQRVIENYLMPSAGIGENSLMPCVGIGVNSLMPMPSAGIGENSLMPIPSAGIGDLVFQPSATFENPDPRMMGMSYLENPFKEIGASSQYERVTPATNRDFQNGENEELDHNQINKSISRIGMKRRFDKLDKSKAKKKGIEYQCNSQQSPMRKNKKYTKEELAEKKTGQEIRTVYRHRIDRQIAQDKETDMKSVLVKRWPMQPDVQGIQQEFQEVANANLEPEEDKERSLEVASKFDILQQQRKKHSTTAGNRDRLDYIVNHLGLYFQDSFLEKLKEQCSGRSPSLLSAFSDLVHQVYDKGNNKVGKESFPGLQEELKKISWEEVPSFLESIVSRIEKDRGIVTDFTHKPTQLLVCAAIKEMEDFSVKKFDLDTLKKWGATLNMAKELGFQVRFADDLLSKNCFAYFAYTQLFG